MHPSVSLPSCRPLMLLAVLVVLVSGLVRGNQDAAFPPIWPLPRSFQNGSSSMHVSANLRLTLADGTTLTRDIQNGWNRFLSRTFVHEAANSSNFPGVAFIHSVAVSIANVDVPLQFNVSESYTLIVPSGQPPTATVVKISAATVYGMYHALETLSQLTRFDFDTQTFQVRHAPWLIHDAPRFPHRGLLIDTSRHYLPVKAIKAIVDSVTYAKVNTIHWHIVDAISFPYDSVNYPRFGAKTAFAPSLRFTQSDVAAVVEYARKRGVRVMVELDTPGHSAAMCLAYPEMCPVPSCTSANVNNWALDITRNRTYEIVGSLLGEFASLFPETFMHLGGDEVDPYCWQQTPYIMQWLHERGMDTNLGYEYYVKRVQNIAWGLSRSVVGWQEIWDHFGTALDKRTVIHQWLPNSTSLPLNVTTHGYRLIWSDSSLWYLDHLSVTWGSMYDAEPCLDLPDANCQLIIGGEGCQWGETVDTSDLEQTVWPRLAAIAERLWSPRAAAVRSQVTTRRLMAFRCLLNERGVRAAPVDNNVARLAPFGPGSCFWQ